MYVIAYKKNACVMACICMEDERETYWISEVNIERIKEKKIRINQRSSEYVEQDKIEEVNNDKNVPITKA